MIHTDRVFDTETIQLSLGQSAPNFWFVDLVRILYTTVKGNHVFDQHVDSLSMLFVLLVNHESLLV